MDSQSRIPRTPFRSQRDAERKRLIAWRESIDERTRIRTDAAIAERLWHALEYLSPGVLALYWPIRGEPDPRPWLPVLAQRGWRFALPRVAGQGLPLEFGRWTPGRPMRAAGFGLMLPDPFELVLPDALVIPCVGFDARAYRLGYGAGFYDRTLEARPVPAIGVAYDGCELSSFEAHTHDRPLDCVLTETRVVRRAP